jgi:hypothetical protein
MRGASFGSRIRGCSSLHWALADGHDWRLLFVNLSEGDGPGRWLVGASACGFVQAEGLESAGKGEKDQGRRRKDSEIEVDQAADPQESMRRRTRHDFSVLAEKINSDKIGRIFFRIFFLPGDCGEKGREEKALS